MNKSIFEEISSLIDNSKDEKIISCLNQLSSILLAKEMSKRKTSSNYNELSFFLLDELTENFPKDNFTEDWYVNYCEQSIIEYYSKFMNKNSKLLIIDDEFDLLDCIKGEIKDIFGISALCGSNGEEGLKILSEVGADVLVTDHYMPKIQGLDLIKKARSSGYIKTNQLVILISGFIPELKKDENILYMTKPFRFGELIKNICILMDGTLQTR